MQESWTDPLVAPLRADVTSGASEVARRASRVVAEAIEPGCFPSTVALPDALVRLVLAVLDAQPEMAPLHTLARELLFEVERQRDGDEDLRDRVRARARAFARTLDAMAAAVADRGAKVLSRSSRVLTLSNSSTVRRSLLLTASHAPVQVVCLEGRPENEGRALAAELSAAGLAVTYAVDAALETLLPACDLLVLGADSIGDAGFVNKIGSAAAARAAHDLGIPTAVIADSSKLLPAGWSESQGASRPPEGVWSAPEGLTVWNRYFEPVPLRWLTSVILEDGTWSPDAITERRLGIDVPASLANWMKRRGPTLR